MSELVEGPVEVRRHSDGRVEIVQAPSRASLSLALLASADPAVFRVDGNRIDLAGQVTYRVISWDPLQSALLLERED